MLYYRGNETCSHSVPASMNICWPNNSYNGGQVVVWMCGSGIITADPTSVSQLADRAHRRHIFHAAPGFSFYLSKRSLLLPASHSRQYNRHSRVSPQKQKFERKNKYIVFCLFKLDLIDRVDAAGYKQINASLWYGLLLIFSGSRQKQSSVGALSLHCYWFLIDSRNIEGAITVRSKHKVQEQDKRGLLCATEQKNIHNTLDLFAFLQSLKER